MLQYLNKIILIIILKIYSGQTQMNNIDKYESLLSLINLNTLSISSSP